MQGNYLQSPKGKAPSASTTPAVDNTTTPDLETPTPKISIVNSHSAAERQNVAEDSDDDAPDPEDKRPTITDTHDRNRSESIPQVTHPGILDLSSDVIETDTNRHSKGIKRYPINYKAEDKGASPIMKTSASTSRPMASGQFSPIVIAASLEDNGSIHDKHSSFVLESDVDYYSQVQQMNGSIGRSRTGTTSIMNPSVLDDEDEDEDIEFDYGSQMDREREMEREITNSRISAR